MSEGGKLPERAGAQGRLHLTFPSRPGACCSPSRRPWRKGEGWAWRQWAAGRAQSQLTPHFPLICPPRSLTIRPALELQVRAEGSWSWGGDSAVEGAAGMGPVYKVTC